MAIARILHTSEPEQTEALGAELAPALKPGDVVLVCGDLGAGKTTFVRGAARALGVTGPVTSPTFSIGHRYAGGNSDDAGGNSDDRSGNSDDSSGNGDDRSGIVVSHLDLYRLAGLAQEEPDLLADYLDDTLIAFVEWPAQDEPEFAQARFVVTLSHLGAHRRRIEVVDRLAAAA